MSGAAVVSTIFFGVPMFVGQPDAARVQTVADHERQAPVSADLPLSTEPAVVVVIADAVAQTTTPMLATPPPAAPRTRTATPPRQTLAVADAPRQRPPVASPSAEPLAKRLGRLLAGTGRYEVKPFPTVSTSGS
jgi:hypothetical protein